LKLGDGSGKVEWNPLCGLPSGAPPERVGSGEWMKFPLAKPPLVLVIPPGDDTAAGFVHLAFFDDDWEPAKLAPAMTAGLKALADVKFPAADTDSVIAPIKKAIHESLLAKRDDRCLSARSAPPRGGKGLRRGHHRLRDDRVRPRVLARARRRSHRAVRSVAIESRHESALAGGFTLAAEGDAEGIAFYTPPGR